MSELRKHPLATVAAGEGAAVAILHRNAPAFYCIPAVAYEALLERLDDLLLGAVAIDGDGGTEVEVSLSDL